MSEQTEEELFGALAASVATAPVPARKGEPVTTAEGLAPLGADTTPLGEAPGPEGPSGAEPLNADGNLANSPDVIFTFSGGMIRPLDPRAEDINIHDIAHALSNQCRFTGHTSHFYSVAEHAIHVSSLVPKHLKLTALLHDASEAYLSDIARPVKRAEGFKEMYSHYEEQLEQATAERFGLTFPWDPAIMQADNLLLSIEIHTLMPQTLREVFPTPANTDISLLKEAWSPEGVPVAPGLPCWDPSRAEIEFQHAYFSLTAAR